MTHLLASVLLGFAGLLPAAPPAAHDFHVSYGRMAVEGKVVMCQIKFFRDDLEATLQAFHGVAGLRMEASARVDTLFARYLAGHFRVEAGGRVLPARIVQSGEEEDMWWYTVQYDAPQPVTALKVTHTMLFDTFADQRNIVKVKHFPSQASESLYFARGAEAYTLTF